MEEKKERKGEKRGNEAHRAGLRMQTRQALTFSP